MNSPYQPSTRHWTFRRYTLPRAVKAYFLGMVQFRATLTTRFWDPRLNTAYNAGRNAAHLVTFRRFEEETL